MWPSMFGSGWPWGVAIALAAAALLVGWFAWVGRLESTHATRTTPPDDSWHRYEEGDLTRQEFVRRRRRAA
jgi:hypothetical protein